MYERWKKKKRQKTNEKNKNTKKNYNHNINVYHLYINRLKQTTTTKIGILNATTVIEKIMRQHVKIVSNSYINADTIFYNGSNFYQHMRCKNKSVIASLIVLGKKIIHRT